MSKQLPLEVVGTARNVPCTLTQLQMCFFGSGSLGNNVSRQTALCRVIRNRVTCFLDGPLEMVTNWKAHPNNSSEPPCLERGDK